MAIGKIIPDKLLKGMKPTSVKVKVKVKLKRKKP